MRSARFSGHLGGREVSAQRGVCSGGIYLGGVCPGGCLPSGCLPRRCTPPTPVNRITDRCKNINLPQTSFAGGKYVKSHIVCSPEDNLNSLNKFFVDI